MRKSTIYLCLAFILITGCAPATEQPQAHTGTPISPTEATTSTPTFASPTATTPAPSQTITQSTQTPAPLPTLTPWEMVQRLVSNFRNQLERGSDGFTGLSIALEQVEPNFDWCNGLSAAINDFNYVRDVENAQKLEAMRADQGCS